MKDILCIVGPTASGKTALSLATARRINGEIVSCDSMQIYKGMDIGTAKPTIEERGGISHHMLDICQPWESYSAARYAREAAACLQALQSRGRTPIIVGGTGLYLQALVHGLHKDIPDDKGAARAHWTHFVQEYGAEALRRKLAEIDPTSAARLPPGDTRRIVRALEVYTQTGETLTQRHARTQTAAPRFSVQTVGLRWPRPVLCARIAQRTDQMLQAGLVEETQRLLRCPLPDNATAIQAIGYREAAAFLRGELSFAEMREAILIATRRYAKRQMTWFSNRWSVLWIDAAQEGGDEGILKILANKGLL